MVPVPALQRAMSTLCVLWLYLTAQTSKDEQGALLLALAVFELTAQTLSRGMTSTLSAICDRLYSANCAPLIGVQIQRMAGFVVSVVIPLLVLLVESATFALVHILADADEFTQTVAHLHTAVHCTVLVVPPLTVMSLLQRYLEGAHIARARTYVTISLVVALSIQIIILSAGTFWWRVDAFPLVLAAFVTAHW